MSTNAGRIAVGTVVAKNYLPFARVLADSLREWHPDVPLFVALADEEEGHFDRTRETFSVLLLHELAIPGRDELLFRYTRQPVTVAAKAYLLEALLDRGFDTAVFIDADILVLDDCDTLFELASRHAVTLVPHLLDPPRGPGAVTRELDVLGAGTYNGGVLGVTATPEARRFLEWWQRRLHTHCRYSQEEGIHFDQRWLDLVPQYFADVHVLRDPGINVAHWNLPERPVVIDGAVTAGGMPCRLFHFSGFDPARPDVVTRYPRSVEMDAIGDAALLFRRYCELLDAAGWPETSDWPYAYDTFDNGVPIPVIAREIYASLEDRARFGDPFSTDSASSYFAWLTHGERGVTNLWRAIYERRLDVQRAFPNALTSEQDVFVQWTQQYGVVEYGIPPELAGSDVVNRTPPAPR